jgi:Mrp family chromosome partitioning ATPase
VKRLRVVDAVRNHPAVVAGITLGCMLLGLLAAVVRPPTYTATTQLYVQVRATDPVAVANIAEAAAALAPAYSRVVHAAAVVDPVARRLGMSPTAVASSVSASPIPVSPVVRVRATASSARRAIQLANLTASGLTRHVQAMNEGSGTEQALLQGFQRATTAAIAATAAQGRLQRAYAAHPTPAARTAVDRATAALRTAQLEVDSARARYQAAETAPLPALISLDQAASATSDKVSKLELLVFLCFLAGLAIGTAAATLLEMVTSRVHTSDAMSESLGLELLARIPPPRKGVLGSKQLVMLQSPDSLEAEAFRVLRMHIEFVSLESGARTFVFASALEGEGRTTTVCNLAVALALAGRRVVVVDGDIRQSGVAPALGLERGLPGLAEIVQRPDEFQLTDAIAHVGLPRSAAPGSGNGATRVGDVDVLPAGQLATHPGEFAADPRLGEVLDELRLRYEFVLIDTPPLLIAADAMAIASRADAAVPVARLGFAPSRDLREFRRLIEAMPCRSIGFVLTGAPARTTRLPTFERVQVRTQEPV